MCPYSCMLYILIICVHSVLPLVSYCVYLSTKIEIFMHPSPGVKRTFPHIPICGTEFPGVEQEAGVVLLVAFSGRSPPNGAPFIRAEHLVYGGAVLVSQGGRGCVTILLRICGEIM